MKRITTAFLLLAGILLTLPGMGQTAQQPSGAPAESRGAFFFDSRQACGNFLLT